MAEERMNLIQKLAKIRSIADVVTKGRRGYNYSYADITEILAKVTAGMNKYGVSLIPIIVPGTSRVAQNVVVNTKTDKTGRTYEQTVTEMIYTAEMIFRWVNDENPEDHIDVPWYVTGSQSDPSQALGSGLTYCTRYFLTNFFQIAQSDMDVDAYRTKQKEAEESEDRTITAEIIKQLDSMVKIYLADNSDQANAVKKFISRYVKNGNYLSIKEPKLAGKLLNDFRDAFVEKKGEE